MELEDILAMIPLDQMEVIRKELEDRQNKINELTEQDKILKEKLFQERREKSFYKHHALVDGLTGAYNRSKFDRDLSVINSMFQRTCVSFVMMEVDNFKEYTDKHGDQAGDAMLQLVYESIRSAVRPSDTDRLYRYSGEQFALALPGLGIKGALNISERVRNRVETITKGLATLSLGVSCFEKDGYRNVTELIKEADQALYSAKEAGRNRVIQYQK